MRLPRSMLKDRITIHPKLGNTGLGGAAYGSSFDEKCIVEPGYKKITDAKGAEVIASAFCILEADSMMKVGNKIEWTGKWYEAVDVQAIRINGQTHHIEAYFKSIGGA
jgi:hypothetical protein